MATPISLSIGKTTAPESRDYATIAAWEADIGVGLTSNLVTSDEVWTVSVYEDTGVAINEPGCVINPTTDPTRNITLTAAAGHSFVDNLTPSSQLIDNIANGVLHYADATWGYVYSTGNNVYLNVNRLQFMTDKNNAKCITSESQNGIIEKMILHRRGTGCRQDVIYAGTGNSLIIRNVLIINNNNGYPGISTGYNTTIDNCTIVNTTGSSTAFGIDILGGTTVINRTAVFNFGTACDTGGTGDYNASDDTSMPGANSLDSLTFANQFVNTSAGSTGDWRLKTGADLIDAANTGGPSDDIIGSTRDANPDIGAWEMQAAATTVTPTTGAFRWTGQTPSSRTRRNFTPTIGTYRWTGLAPVVGTVKSYSPTTGAFNWSGLTPAVRTSTRAIPTLGTIQWTGIAPSIYTIRQATPALGAINWAGLTPTIYTLKSTTPTTGAYQWTGSAPVVTTGGVVDATPTTGIWQWTGIAPAIYTLKNRTPILGNFQWSGLAPSVSIPAGPVTATPTLGAFIWTGSTPSAYTIRNVIPTIGAYQWTGATPASRTIRDFAPTIGAYQWIGSTPSARTIKAVTPTVGIYQWTGSTIAAIGIKVATPTTGIYQWTGSTITVTTGDVVSVTPTIGSYQWTGLSPSIYTLRNVTLAQGAYQWTGTTITVTIGSPCDWTTKSRSLGNWNTESRQSGSWNTEARQSGTWATKTRVCE